MEHADKNDSSMIDQQFEKRFEEFVERTDADLAQIKYQVNSLWNFKMLILGASLAVSTLSSALISVLYIYYGVH
jgi:hypothetical protein